MSNPPIVIEVPQNLKALADSFSRLVEKVSATIANNTGGRGANYATVEGDFGDATAEVERAAHEATLASLDVDVPAVTVGGVIYNRSGKHVGVYSTLAGKVRVVRTLYREAGVRNGAQLDPIATRIGAFGNGWLPKAARGVAFLMQQGTEREAADASKEVGRLRYAASTFKRVAHIYGEEYRACRADIEDVLIEEFEVPKGAVALSVSIDRTSVPMEEPRKRKPGRPRKNEPKRLVARKFRMAWCGTLTIHREDGEGVETIRYGAMPGADPNLLCARMAVDAHKLIEKHGDMKLVLLADGAHELWNLLEEHFPASVFGEAIRLVDFWHLIEKLAAASKVIFSQGADKMTAARWKSHLRRADSAIVEILAELKESGMDEVRVGDNRPVHEAITYLGNHAERMRYSSARKAGLPIGSGNVEATCKSLMQLRMKRPGSRWHEATGENIVQLRALALSDRWNTAMSRFLKQRVTAVRAVA